MTKLKGKKMCDWIDNKKQKPASWQRVLIALDNGSVVTGLRSPIGWDWDETDNPDDFDAAVSYWMAFPNHPDKRK